MVRKTTSLRANAAQEVYFIRFIRAFEGGQSTITTRRTRCCCLLSAPDKPPAVPATASAYSTMSPLVMNCFSVVVSLCSSHQSYTPSNRITSRSTVRHSRNLTASPSQPWPTAPICATSPKHISSIMQKCIGGEAFPSG